MDIFYKKFFEISKMYPAEKHMSISANRDLDFNPLIYSELGYTSGQELKFSAIHQHSIYGIIICTRYGQVVLVNHIHHETGIMVYMPGYIETFLNLTSGESVNEKGVRQLIGKDNDVNIGYKIERAYQVS